MKKGVDPVYFITYLKDLWSRLADAGIKMTNEHFILQILNVTTKGYTTEVCLIEEKLDKNEVVTVDNLKDCLSLEYERVQKWKANNNDDNDESEEETEKAFAATQFKGQCNYCGKYGHKAAECHQKKRDQEQQPPGNNNNKRFNGNCNYCGKFGHKELEYQKKKADQEEANIACDDCNNYKMVFTFIEETKFIENNNKNDE